MTALRALILIPLLPVLCLLAFLDFTITGAVPPYRMTRGLIKAVVGIGDL